MTVKTELVIWQNDCFEIRLPGKPHVSREEGGHLVVYPKRDAHFRSELTMSEASSLGVLLQAIEVAYIRALNDVGTQVVWINFQDNGNWSLLKGDSRHFHVHVYGRCLQEQKQAPGQALYLPDPNSEYYSSNVPLRRNEIAMFVNYLESELERAKTLSNGEPFSSGMLPNRYSLSLELD